MNILAIETATETSSCAVLTGEHIYIQSETGLQRHTQVVLPLAQAVISEAGIQVSDLDAVAFGRGPGSFTGLRVACCVAQAVGFAMDIPLLPISTLATLAQTAFLLKQQQCVCAVLDARMNEVYCGYYACDTNGVMQPCSEEVVCPAADIPLPAGQWYGVGNGWQAYSAVLQARLGAQLMDYDGTTSPDAAAMLTLAKVALAQDLGVSAAEAVPVYLRNRVVG